MDNPSKKIEINKSALFDLKTELARKKNVAFQEKSNESELVESKNETKSKKHKKQEKPVKELKLVDVEELELLRKSKKILEAKAKVYESLSKPGTSTELTEDIYLVQFSEKQIEVARDIQKVEEQKEIEAQNKSDSDSEHSDDEVEYTDYFGRSRKCQRSELHNQINKDKKLSKVLKLFRSDTLLEDIETKKQSENSDKTSESSELLSADMRREILRKEWEEQEEILRQKSVIHYQDILFDDPEYFKGYFEVNLNSLEISNPDVEDEGSTSQATSDAEISPQEARLHGVAFYKFSSDEAEREQQHKELNNIRAETVQEQKKRAVIRAQREKDKKAKIFAARNRLRIRQGLPPLEEAEDETPLVPEETEEQKLAAAKKVEKEREKEKLREEYLRPWDEGKEGVPIFTELTQEQWVEKQRSERKEEFAPPTVFKEKIGTKTFDSTGYIQRRTEIPKHISVAHISKSIQKINEFVAKVPPPSSVMNVEEKLKQIRAKVEADAKMPPPPPPDQLKRVILSKPGPSCSTQAVKRKRKPPPLKEFKPSLIVNEVDYDDSEEELDYAPKKVERKGTEIPPPCTFEYYGPSGSKIAKKTTKPDLEDAYSAGLKYLEDKSKDKGKHKLAEQYDIM